jgi:hypothetical protein
MSKSHLASKEAKKPAMRSLKEKKTIKQARKHADDAIPLIVKPT